MRLRFFVPIAVLVMASGCNDSPPEVTGMVTLDEKPLDDATIVFEAKDGKVAPATGKIQNGKYTLKVAPGEKVVRILAMRPSAKKDAVMGANPMESIVPAAYNTQSKLTANVEAGKANTFDYPLKSKP